MKFERSLYEVTENARMMELCLERVDNNKIAPNISIDLMIIERSTKPLGMNSTGNPYNCDL